MSALESALRLVDAGFSVFPVAADKTPLVRGWTTEAATNADDVERLFSRFPDAPAVGVSCGMSGIAVVDIDPRNGSEATVNRLMLDKSDEWLRSVTAETPRGGLHIYYATNGRRVRSGTHALGPGVDVKAANGYIIAPESTSEYGVYHWLEGYSPIDRKMLDVPDWLVKAVGTARQRTRQIQRREGDTKTEQVRDIPYLLGFSDLPLSDGRLREIATDEAVMRFLSHHLGIPDAPLGTAFHCVLREDEHPSAALYQDSNGVVMYHDFHAEGSPLEWLTLAEAYAAQITGAVEKFTKMSPTHAAWFIRFMVDAGLLPAAPVTMRPLRKDASRSLSRVYEGVRLLFGCKWRYTPGDPSPLAWRFTAGWCGVSPETAGAGVRALLMEGIIKQVGTYPVRGKEMSLFLPCDYS